MGPRLIGHSWVSMGSENRRTLGNHGKIMGFKTRLAILGSFTVGLVIFMAAGVQVFESFQAPKKAATTEGTISIRTKRVPWFALMR